MLRTSGGSPWRAGKQGRTHMLIFTAAFLKTMNLYICVLCIIYCIIVLLYIALLLYYVYTLVLSMQVREDTHKKKCFDNFFFFIPIFGLKQPDFREEKKVFFCLLVYPPYTLSGPTTKKNYFMRVFHYKLNGLFHTQHTTYNLL